MTNPNAWIVPYAEAFLEALCSWPEDVADLVVEKVVARTGYPPDRDEVVLRLRGGMLPQVHSVAEAVEQLREQETTP